MSVRGPTEVLTLLYSNYLNGSLMPSAIMSSAKFTRVLLNMLRFETRHSRPKAISLHLTSSNQSLFIESRGFIYVVLLNHTILEDANNLIICPHAAFPD